MKTIGNAQKAAIAHLGLSKTQSVSAMGSTKQTDAKKRRLDDENKLLVLRLQNIKSGLKIDDAAAGLKKPRKLPQIPPKEPGATDPRLTPGPARPEGLSLSQSEVSVRKARPPVHRENLSQSHGFSMELTGQADGVKAYLRWRDLETGETLLVCENELMKGEIVREDLSFAEIGNRAGIKFEVTVVGGTTRSPRSPVTGEIEDPHDQDEDFIMRNRIDDLLKYRCCLY